MDGEAVLMLSDLSMIEVLNKVGTRVFELADGTLTVADIVAAMQNEYSADAEEIHSDTVAFVQRLVDEKILVLSSTPETE